MEGGVDERGGLHGRHRVLCRTLAGESGREPLIRRAIRRLSCFWGPDSFTHGSSAQRVRWFKRGLQSGDLRRCDTFAADTL
ncbi:MAG: neutral zinc metallopeptidase [Acetobacteraceae bacterium]|nr:neutral zinc metallopeptidase [Acetobacteraceae bacterium]